MVLGFCDSELRLERGRLVAASIGSSDGASLMIANPNPELDANLYETDFYAWTQTQAKLLQAGRWQELDVPNLGVL